MIKVASLQYRYDFPSHFEAYREKILSLVRQHAKQGVRLLVFPEYAGLEMLSFAPLEKLQKDLSAYLDLFKELSHQYQMFICSGTHIVATEKGTFNRSFLFSPNGKMAYQDKCLLTPYEVQEGVLSQGDTLRLFETELGKIGICVCYDIEFPSLSQKFTEAGVQLLLVPSYTSSIHGFYRVFTSCRARALENQCYVIQSALVGQTDVEIAYGASTVCTPIDESFPEDGILALGNRDQPESVTAFLDFSKLEVVRKSGQTHNYLDADQLRKRLIHFESADLR